MVNWLLRCDEELFERLDHLLPTSYHPGNHLRYPHRYLLPVYHSIWMGLQSDCMGKGNNLFTESHIHSLLHLDLVADEKVMDPVE